MKLNYVIKDVGILDNRPFLEDRKSSERWEGYWGQTLLNC